MKDQFLNKDAPEPEIDSAPAPPAADESKASEDYHAGCPPAPYKCPVPCRGACCSQWNCPVAPNPYPYGGMAGRQLGICGPRPVTGCPRPCNGYCCGQWGCPAGGYGGMTGKQLGICGPRPVTGCPRPCNGYCCGEWGCATSGYGGFAMFSLPRFETKCGFGKVWSNSKNKCVRALGVTVGSQNRINCPPAPYICPKPCRGQCCVMWGC